MRNKYLIAALGAFAATSLTSVPAAAQDSPATVDTSYGNPQQEEDDDFPWGLLGLLGLAGLIQRKRKDHVQVDNTTRR